MDYNLAQGEALFSNGNIKDAETCFLELIRNDPNNKEAYNNLGVIAFQRKEIEKAIDYFNESLKLDPFYKEAVINYVNLLLELQLFSEAAAYLKTVTTQYPNDNELTGILDDIHRQFLTSQKIAFLSLPGFEAFLDEIVRSLADKHNIISCFSNTISDIETAIKQSDIVWLEWANELAITLTNHPSLLNGKHVICRMHSYEALTDNIRNINWERIDDLIFVADHIKRIACQSVPDIEDRVDRVHVIPNGINLDNYHFKNRIPGHDLAYLGNLNFKKGPMLLLHAFKALADKNDRYRLHIAGKFQDLRYKLYFDQMIKEFKLENNIILNGWIEDVSSWLDDKQYIVCTSVLEGHPVGIMEAMACGLKPLIHNYVGAKETYPEKYIWNTIQEFVEMVMENDYHPRRYRGFIEENSSLDIQIEQIHGIISSISK